MRRAVIVFLVSEARVLLLHSHYDSTETRIFWQGVSGYIENDESAVDAAVREVNEELNIVVDTRDLVQRHQFEVSSISFTVFTASKWQGDPKPLEQGIGEIRWFPIDQLPLDEMHPTDKDWLPGILAN